MPDAPAIAAVFGKVTPNDLSGGLHAGPPLNTDETVTGRQYIAISVGGAAHSPNNGDYVMDFSLPDTQK
jgi:glucose dehydrogenase